MENYKNLINDLELCSKGGPCADCTQDTKWNCDWLLMEKAKKAIQELLDLKKILTKERED